MFDRLLAALALVGLAASVAACGSSSGGTTTVVTVVKQEPSSEGAPADNPSSDSSSSEGSIVSDDGTGDDSGGGKITVPNEIGKNHQAAQDDMQAHGLYNLAEEDATGRGRMLILDRNWKVVSQSPAPGEKVNEDTTITLRSKKYTDD
jgi:beta-lactam-binding protein with PASTA domain